MSAHSASVASSSTQYLTFVVAGEEYGVEILSVHEIRAFSPVTRIPHAPDWVVGLLNLRGAIVPVVDLRVRFGLERTVYSKTTVVVVLAVTGPHGQRRIGIVVDAVADVLDASANEVAPPPDLGTAVRSDLFRGMATVGERTVILLETNKLLTTDELQTLTSLRH